MSYAPRVEITFCYQCNWTARAAWMAQEVLASLEDSVGEVALVPATGGTFDIRVDGTLVWSREEEERFPQPKELKQRVRDAVAPDTDLGHADAN
ncbi:MAG: SelT/selW/selH selenoprotein [Bacteroidetes bacterium SW_9_63_38]|nr:MAG: SelT/selW/selH selenoprotein [Bacteroidetes bacterium SW_9_63_38]